MTNRRRNSNHYWKLLLACMLAVGTALSAPRSHDETAPPAAVQLSHAMAPAATSSAITRSHQ